jgi:metal-responsive CopG/Arc/MetJ family transcriptional regulator
VKPCINVTIDKDLLDKLENDRFKRIQKEKKDISRSSFITELIRKGLNK